MSCRSLIRLTLCALIGATGSAFAGEVMLFDFREGDHGWSGNPRVENFRATPEGIAFESVGEDPWVEGPTPDNLPTGERLRLTIRMRSTGDHSGEVFYGEVFEAGKSSTFTVLPDGEWHEYAVTLPPLEEGARLRVDPAFGEGEFVIQWIKAQPLTPVGDIPLPQPRPVEIPDDRYRVASNGVAFHHDGQHWNGFAVYVNGQRMADGFICDRIGYVLDGDLSFVELDEAQVTVRDTGAGLTIAVTLTDPDGATWTLRRIARPNKHGGAIDVETRIHVDADRDVAHLPWLTLFPGLATFGESKTQAILPGVEYLADEPSSSEADLEGEQAIRRIVEDYKLTLPMMSIVAEDRYVGLTWDRREHPAPVFDSPDRMHNSGAHLMALWRPGVGTKREENAVAPHSPMRVEANNELAFSTTIFGGEGKSVVPAVQHYVRLTGGLPPLPELDGGSPHMVRLLSAGWLDSRAHEDGYWRHAYWPGFGAQPAADAPAFMLWLARYADAELAQRLRDGARRGRERLPQTDPLARSVGHVNRPVPALVFGNDNAQLDEFLERRLAQARNLLEQFHDEGLRRYVAPEEGPDYGRTHFADHANGHGAIPLETILQTAVFTGDAELAERGLAILDKQASHYAQTVPRGSQTWEIALHTPDILASGRMVRVYVLGYQLTGDKAYLDQARYWAWTGVPFVYLDPPTDGPTGLYASIAVLGATHWVTPNWIGLPVQWCGLVYRSAIQELAFVDAEEGPFWDKLARGITASGLQQTFPLDDDERQGLLPDFFHLDAQRPDGPPISSGTVQAHVAELYGKTPWFRTKRMEDSGIVVHAPGALSSGRVEGDLVSVRVDGWPEEPYLVRLTGVEAVPARVMWNDEDAGFHYEAERNAMTVTVEGAGTLAVQQ